MIKQFVKSAIEKVFSLIGYKVIFYPKSVSLMVLFDKFIWEPFFKPNSRIKLYFEGLKQAKVEWSDNLPKQCRFYSLQQSVEFVLKQDLIGDFAECGCWKGHSSYIIASILYGNQFVGEFHIFDIFEGGLSVKDTEDKNLRFELNRQALERESKIFFSTEEEVKANLSSFQFIRLYKGWIPERFKEVANKKFAFVHIDVDLYQPTRDSLEFFYPKLPKNGCIVVDDYGYCQFPGSKKAVDEFLKNNSCYMFYELPMGGCFIIK